jgi:hypothetical protein
VRNLYRPCCGSSAGPWRAATKRPAAGPSTSGHPGTPLHLLEQVVSLVVDAPILLVRHAANRYDQAPRRPRMDAGAANGATVHLLGYRLLMRSQLSRSHASAFKPRG